ncbi:MAG TPA: response regulator [Blastocatellia bacterium]|nr:response regulator [Blastocatellia bacterium]
MKLITPGSGFAGNLLLLNPKRQTTDAIEQFDLIDILLPFRGVDPAPGTLDDQPESTQPDDTDGASQSAPDNESCEASEQAVVLTESLDQFVRHSLAQESVEECDQPPQELADSDDKASGDDEDETTEVSPYGFDIVSGQSPFTGLDFYRKSSDEPDEDNRRRCERHLLSIPASVTGHDEDGSEWSEETETIDVSRTGLILNLRRWTQHGKVMRLSLPLPDELRRHEHSDLNYEVYAIVRRIGPVSNGSKPVGMEFLGEHPPEGYFEKPWASFQVRRSSAFDRRRRLREPASDVIWIEYLNEAMECMAREATRTENISSGGMRVYIKAPPPEFEMVKVGYSNRAFESYAIISNRYVGCDGLNRLCLQFLDKNWYDQKDSAGKSPTRQDPRRKILLADDDPPLRKVLGKILTQAGYEVIMAEDGKSAVEKSRTAHPDLVITDVLMPKMNGFQVCKLLKEFASPPKVILLSGVYSKPSYRRQARDEYGADDLLPKPFEVASLLSLVKQHLTNQEAGRSA